MTGFGGQTSFTYHCFNVKMYLLKIVGTAYKVRLVRRVHMAKKVVAIGKQSFESVIENDNFYVDKTFFIKCNKEVLICVQYLKKQDLREEVKE